MRQLDPGAEKHRDVRGGRRISAFSLTWTLAVGAAAVGAGVISGSLLLIAFGAVGALDALGSASLVVHFRHAIHHREISARHELLALRLVTFGMAAIGVATVAESIQRLESHAVAETIDVGIALAAISVIVLSALAVVKRRVAARIPSHALHADSWLSAIGAVLAMITLAGMAIQATVGWWWVDSVAAIGIGCGAVGLSFVLGRDART